MGNRRWMATIGAVVLAATVVWAVPAGAAELSDPDDLVGVLDIEDLEAEHEAGSAPMEISISFHDAFADADLAGGSGNKLRLLFDVDRNGTADFSGRIKRAGSALVISIKEGGSNRFEPLPVTREATDGISMVIPGSAPMNPSRAIALRVVATTPAGTDRTRWLEVPVGSSGTSVPSGCTVAEAGRVSVVADGTRFTEGRCIRVAADAAFTIVFVNRDDASRGGPHNIAIFPGRDHLMHPNFRGATVEGPATVEYRVSALQAGSYYFHCDVHPSMSGSVYAVVGG